MEDGVTTATGTVFNTDGLALNVRSKPSTSSSILTTIAAGTKVTIKCQIEGDWVGSTKVWNFLSSYSGYVSDEFLLTGYDGFIPGVPKCGSTSGGGGGTPLVVNGHTLNANQDKWVRWIAKNTVPALSGTRDERLTTAARVTWWSLKEGVLSLDNPIPYSNCNNAHVGPLTVCSSSYTWQAGISGIQPRNYTLSSTEGTALALYPGSTIKNVLADAALAAGYASGTSMYNSIVGSTGDLRNSWLLRHHAVAFTKQAPLVTSECITNSKYWCYGTGWGESAAYAPDKNAALKSIGDLKAILGTLAP
jgi:hypothetical protein